MKKLSLSISDYAYDICFGGYNGNRSEKAEKLMLLGVDLEIGAIERMKSLQIQVIQENRDLKVELDKVKLQLAALQKKWDSRKLTDNEKDPDMARKIMEFESWKNISFGELEKDGRI